MKIRALQTWPDGTTKTYTREGRLDFKTQDDALEYMRTHGETVWHIGYTEDLILVHDANVEYLESGRQIGKWKPVGLRGQG